MQVPKFIVPFDESHEKNAGILERQIAYIFHWVQNIDANVSLSVQCKHNDFTFPAYNLVRISIESDKFQRRIEREKKNLLERLRKDLVS